MTVLNNKIPSQDAVIEYVEREKGVNQMTEQANNSRKKPGLTTKIFMGLIAGLIVGLIFNLAIPHGFIRDTIFVDGIFYIVGNGFIRFMKMLVVPLVFCSLVCGAAAIGDTKALGKVGGKTILFYLFTTAFAVTVAITIATFIRPGVGLDMSSIEKSEMAVAESTSMTDTILNIIPENPIGALASGTMLQIILFALLVGVLLARMGERADLIYHLFNQINDLMMEMTTMIMHLAPFGVFCMVAKSFFQPWFQRHAAPVQIHDRSCGRSGYSVLYRLYGAFFHLYKTESSEIPEEILPGYGFCLFYIGF